MATGGNLRTTEIQEFLDGAGWGEAARTPLNADASTRRYERLRRKTETAMLMDAPPLESQPCPPGAADDERLKLGWNAISRLAASRVEAFAAVASHLQGLGLSAPTVLEHDISRGLALLEDLGDDLFAEVILKGGDEIALYAAAGDVLAAVHRAPAPFIMPYRGGEWPILTYDHLAADVLFKWRGFSLEAEALLRYAEQPSLMGATTTEWARAGWGYYVQAGYLPIDAFEVSARWGQLRPFTGTDPSFKHQRELGVGVGWYPKQHNLKLQSDVFWLPVGERFDVGSWQVRAQLQLAF